MHLFYSENAPMIFTHSSFWVFFLAVLLVYSCLYRKKRLRNAFLFIVSIYFYYRCGGYYFSLLLVSIVVNYLTGRMMSPLSSKKKKKAMLFAGVAFNLLMLAYFKFAYFVADCINRALGTSFRVENLLADWSNRVAGTHFDISQIVLPVGISFFTFQAISYIVDVYREKTLPVKNILDFGFYLSFFPQLVAGPIVRASEFIPQIYRDFQLRKAEMGHALFLIGSGLVKKMIISDYISINFVDRVFDQPVLYSGFENLMAVYGYTLQIYCDFSGYTDIAIGVALLLGFRLPINFNSPYHAESISDFWRRWHISLSSWLRDYLYIPLGGNRKGVFRTGVNLLITMLLGGLWHGAHLRFIIWGGLHGLALLVHKGIQRFSPLRKERKSPLRKFIGVVLTFHFVAFCWIFFRADDMQSALAIIRRIATPTSFPLIGEIVENYRKFFIILAVGFFIHWLPAQRKEQLRGRYIRFSLPVKMLLAVLLFFFIYQMKSSVILPFVYFQF
jgi:D-alanyl-lipoteichoic acid acyltransferase DltB (MBOAT superfamily)